MVMNTSMDAAFTVISHWLEMEFQGKKAHARDKEKELTLIVNIVCAPFALGRWTPALSIFPPVPLQNDLYHLKEN